MAATRNTRGLNRGWRGPRDRREGRKQRAVRRLLIAADGKPVSGRELLQAAYPRLDMTKTLPAWYWDHMRRSALRYAERILEARSRPLRWRLKPEFQNKR